MFQRLKRHERYKIDPLKLVEIITTVSKWKKGRGNSIEASGKAACLQDNRLTGEEGWRGTEIGKMAPGGVLGH